MPRYHPVDPVAAEQRARWVEMERARMVADIHVQAQHSRSVDDRRYQHQQSQERPGSGHRASPRDVSSSTPQLRTDPRAVSQRLQQSVPVSHANTVSENPQNVDRRNSEAAAVLAFERDNSTKTKSPKQVAEELTQTGQTTMTAAHLIDAIIIQQINRSTDNDVSPTPTPNQQVPSTNSSTQQTVSRPRPVENMSTSTPHSAPTSTPASIPTPQNQEGSRVNQSPETSRLQQNEHRSPPYKPHKMLNR